LTSIICDVCPRRCELKEGETGFCGVRNNRKGRNTDGLYRQLYDWPGHFRSPATEPAYALYFIGCNLKCPFCAVPFLSRPASETTPIHILPEAEAVEWALTSHVGTLSFFGGEPALHHEYVAEAAKLCKGNGIVTYLNTNGYMSPWVISKLASLANVSVIGVKGSGSSSVYAKMKADPQVVLDAAETSWRANRDTRITNLVGPGFDPTKEQDEALADWILEKMAPDVFIQIESVCEPMMGSFLSRHNYIGGPKEAHHAAYTTAVRLARRGLRNVWIQNCEAMESDMLPPGESWMIHVVA